MKAEFRKTIKWIRFRNRKRKECGGIDLITNSKLIPGCSLHHKDLRIENYKNVSDPARFIFLNHATHDFIHWLYVYYKDDPEILERIRMLLEEMKSCSSDKICDVANDD